mmetsp:Transcript_11697/g.8537  ORF Transcript_11697/g.8537 Transcript_11697/m.8537 type:complete len:140 (+) Transcript_11697:821-1240(+)
MLMFTPPLLLLNKKYPRLGLGIIAFMYLSCCSITFALVYKNNINAVNYYDFWYQRYLTYRPYFRYPSYLMGLILGVIVFRLHDSNLIVKIRFRPLIYLVSLAVGLGCILILGLDTRNSCRGNNNYMVPSSFVESCFSNW